MCRPLHKFTGSLADEIILAVQYTLYIMHVHVQNVYTHTCICTVRDHIHLLHVCYGYKLFTKLTIILLDLIHKYEAADVVCEYIGLAMGGGQ